MFKGSRRIVLAAAAFAVAIPSLAQAMQGDDVFDRMVLIQKRREQEARGGPYIVGGASPFQARIKVCNRIPTEVRDPRTGGVRTELREVCWWE